MQAHHNEKTMCLPSGADRVNPSGPDPGWKEEMNVNFYFQNLKLYLHSNNNKVTLKKLY